MDGSSRSADIDGAAADDGIICIDNANRGGIGGVAGSDRAAVDGEGAGDIDGRVRIGGVAGTEGTGAEGLAVDGQAWKGNDGLVIATIDGQSVAVGEDEAHVAVADYLAIVADVAVHDVPFGLALGAEVALAAGEHGGGYGLCVAVLVDVIGLDGFCPRRRAGHDEGERHGRPHEVVFD